MLTSEAIGCPAEALARVRDFVRVDGVGEDPLLESLVETAIAVCEGFTGQVLVTRGFTQSLPASAAWARLGRGPVVEIFAVRGTDGVALTPEAHAVDIDANGDGWVRVASGTRVRVEYRAGLAAGWAGVPEALRHGVVRLAVHLYAERDGGAGDGRANPPAAVTALWRPYRRMLFGRATGVR